MGMPSLRPVFPTGQSHEPSRSVLIPNLNMYSVSIKKNGVTANKGKARASWGTNKTASQPCSLGIIRRIACKMNDSGSHLWTCHILLCSRCFLACIPFLFRHWANKAESLLHYTCLRALFLYLFIAFLCSNPDLIPNRSLILQYINSIHL